jgi:hypothetical protein
MMKRMRTGSLIPTGEHMRMQWRLLAFLGFTLAVLIGVFFLHRIPQNPAYHLFADSRSIWGIPNFFNVISNLPFFVAGMWGLIHTIPNRQTQAFREKYERWPYIVFFLGLALTCFGSAYYHWAPDNRALAWDRLPMTVGFIGIFAGTIGDRIGPRIGRVCLAPMLVFGISSVLYWYFSEMKGVGDLRPYVVVQFYTIVAVILLVILFPARYTHAGWLIAGGGAYVLAKVFEALDKPIFDLTKISGHTLKHLAASLTAIWIGIMLRRRAAI